MIILLVPFVHNKILINLYIPFCTIFYLVVKPVVEEDPCDPNPCGPNSNSPRNYGGSDCQCSCLPGMIGNPPNCRPECVFNNDCPTDKACQSQNCVDPCPGLCGSNAYCRVRNHIPICVCNKGFTGDPFVQCSRITSRFIYHQNIQF